MEKDTCCQKRHVYRNSPFNYTQAFRLVVTGNYLEGYRPEELLERILWCTRNHPYVTLCCTPSNSRLLSRVRSVACDNLNINFPISTFPDIQSAYRYANATLAICKGSNFPVSLPDSILLPCIIYDRISGKHKLYK